MVDEAKPAQDTLWARVAENLGVTQAYAKQTALKGLVVLLVVVALILLIVLVV